MSLPRRPLAGLKVNISISEGEDSAARGFPNAGVNRVTLQIATALLGQGAVVVFGHDWRHNGVMEAIHGFAQQVQPLIPVASAEADMLNQPLLQNYLPWPDQPAILNTTDLERLQATLLVVPGGLPEELSRLQMHNEFVDEGDEGYRYLRARGLTHLRHRLTANSDARICLGGRMKESAGRFAGVAEEALLSVEAHQPLYVSGVLGGAAQQVIDALLGRRNPFAPGLASQMYERPPLRETDPRTLPDRNASLDRLVERFEHAGLPTISQDNFLLPEENMALFEASSLEEAIRLVLSGLSRLQAARGERAVP